MASPERLTLVALAVLGAAVAACTPAEAPADKAAESTTTVVETREVPGPTVVVEKEVPVAVPPVVIERDRDSRETTTVRAGEDGIEVETTRPRP